jgi:hypothetical protein
MMACRQAVIGPELRELLRRGTEVAAVLDSLIESTKLAGVDRGAYAVAATAATLALGLLSARVAPEGCRQGSFPARFPHHLVGGTLMIPMTPCDRNFEEFQWRAAPAA